MSSMLCTNPMPVSDYVVNPEESRYLNESLIILYDQLARKIVVVPKRGCPDMSS